MLNRIVLIGRLTKNPELKYTPAGVPVAQLSIAVNRVTKNDKNEYDVDYFDIVAWRRTAEFASNYLTKGRLVSVDGRLQTRSWEAQDGTKRKSFEIVAENLEGLDRKPEGMEGGEMGDRVSAAPRDSAPPMTPRPASATRNSAPAHSDDDLDESDPFADE